MMHRQAGFPLSSTLHYKNMLGDEVCGPYDLFKQICHFERTALNLWHLAAKPDAQSWLKRNATLSCPGQTIYDYSFVLCALKQQPCGLNS